MRKISIVLLLMATPLYAGSPSFVGPKDGGTYAEFLDVYHDLEFPNIVNGRASTMTVTQLNVSTMTLSGRIQFKDGTTQNTAASAAKVFQVLMSSASDSATSTSATYADTGLIRSITPSSASHGILILVTQVGQANTSTGQTVAIAGYRILRGATNIFEDTQAWGLNWTNVDTGNLTNGNTYTSGFVYCDSPATTSATIYKTQFNRISGSDGSVGINRSSTNNGVMILMEVDSCQG